MTSKGRHTAVCISCEQEIFRFINRKPPGPWTHKDSNLLACWRNGKYDKNEKASPKARSIRS